MRTVVLDTNVLLSSPSFVSDYPGTDVIIPDTVLAEIDKLKTARVDPELRFRGREVSRVLFELSDRGTLHEGVALPGGGMLRVVALRNENDLPEGLSARNADDRILAIALQACAEGCEGLTLMTNDLNMLLKAQSLGLEVERAEFSDTFSKRFIVRPFQRYKVPLGILAVAVAVFAAVVALIIYSPTGRTQISVADLPDEFVDQMSLEQQQMLGYLLKLEQDPDDAKTHLALANLYDQMAAQNAAYLPLATEHYESVAELTPTDYDARSDLATTYFQAGRVETAIKTAKSLLAEQPDHVKANFNLGLFYLNSKPPQYQQAADQFEKILRLTENESGLAAIREQAQRLLESTLEAAEKAGEPVKTDGGTL